MGRTRRLDELRNDARKRADVESATDRHPDADVTRYVNQGITELYDLLIDARGRSFFRKPTPHEITTLANTTRYPLPADFYQLISVRREGETGDLLDPFTAEDEPWLRATSATATYATHYELQNGTIELLPLHAAGSIVAVEYIPTPTDLAADADTFDGINGWEEYVVAFAAREMAWKDDEPSVAAACTAQMAALAARIAKLATQRDRFRAPRVRDVRRRWWR